MPSFFRALFGDRGRGVRHQVGAARGLGEGDDFADGGFPGQDHHQAIEAQGDSTVRRRAVFERVQEITEAATCLVVREADRSKTFAWMSRR